MKNIILFLLLGFAFFFKSCVLFEEKPLQNHEKQWVYIELITESKTDTTEYFYYGQIKKSLIDEIESNEEKKGLFTLSNIRLWNDNQLLELYEDNNVKGELIFKIQDIEEIILYKDDPINLFDLEELHESCKKIRNEKK